MARKEGYSKGVIPLSTLRADIDYAIEKAHTTVGIIGVKVWINRGIILDKGLNNQVVHQKRTFTNNYTHGPRGGKPQ
jgi:ribosomal protein S3